MKGIYKSLSPFLPSSSGASVFLVVLVYFLVTGHDLLLKDGGSCRHLTTGLYFLEHLNVPTTNYTSALFTEVPCLTNSLLGDIAFGLAYKFWQLNGIVLLCAAAMALTYMWSYQFARARGLGARLSLSVLVLVTFASSLHWTARCHIFSYLFFLILYYVQFLEQSYGIKKMFLTSALMVCWINFHASVFIGILILICKTGGTVLETVFGTRGSKPLGVLGWDITTFLATLVAFCINLRGPSIYNYMFGYLLHPMIQFESPEWRSIDFVYGFQIWPFLFLLVIVAASWTYSDHRPKPGEFLLISALFLLGVHSMRIIPYFALLALPAAAVFCRQASKAADTQERPVKTDSSDLLAETGREPDPSDGNNQLGAEKIEAGARKTVSHTFLKNRFAIVQSAMAFVVAVCFLVLPQFKVLDFNPLILPVGAVSFIEKQKLTGLGFVWDNWGGYLYWRLGRQVFIDDWTDYYPVNFVLQYLAVIRTQPGWETILDSYHLQYVLIPKFPTPIGFALSRSTYWQRVFSDDASELYIRR